MAAASAASMRGQGCDKGAKDGEFCIKHGAVLLQCAHVGCIKPARFGGMCWDHTDDDYKAKHAKHVRIAYAKKRTQALIAQAELAVAKFGTQLEA